jgi:hypothetical protein
MVWIRERRQAFRRTGDVKTEPINIRTREREMERALECVENLHSRENKAGVLIRWKMLHSCVLSVMLAEC